MKIKCKSGLTSLVFCLAIPLAQAQECDVHFQARNIVRGQDALNNPLRQTIVMRLLREEEGDGRQIYAALNSGPVEMEERVTSVGKFVYVYGCQEHFCSDNYIRGIYDPVTGNSYGLHYQSDLVRKVNHGGPEGVRILGRADGKIGRKDEVMKKLLCQ